MEKNKRKMATTAITPTHNINENLEILLPKNIEVKIKAKINDTKDTMSRKKTHTLKTKLFAHKNNISLLCDVLRTNKKSIFSLWLCVSGSK